MGLVSAGSVALLGTAQSAFAEASLPSPPADPVGVDTRMTSEGTWVSDASAGLGCPLGKG